jgi:hypothetical protein
MSDTKNDASTPALPAGSKTKSWRDCLKVHEAANLFPPMTAEELRELGEDIKKNGLLTPIALFKNKLIDGCNRLDAMQMVGISFEVWREDKNRFELSADVKLPWGGGFCHHSDDGDPYAFVVAANLRRRHLTAEQKRDVIAKLLKAQPEKSNRQIAETAKVDHKTVGTVRAEQERRGEIPHVAERRDTKGRKQPVKTPPTAAARLPAPPEAAPAPAKVQLSPSMAAVRIDSGPIEAADQLRDVPREKWHDLMLARRQFMEIRLSHDCRCLVEFVNDAELMFEALCFSSPEAMIREGFKLDPQEVALAIEWLRLNPSEHNPEPPKQTIRVAYEALPAAAAAPPAPAEPVSAGPPAEPDDDGIPTFLRRARRAPDEDGAP